MHSLFIRAVFHSTRFLIDNKLPDYLGDYSRLEPWRHHIVTAGAEMAHGMQ